MTEHYIPTYLDINKHLFLGVSASQNKFSILEKFDRYIRIGEPILLKNERYYPVFFDEEEKMIEKDLKYYCRLFKNEGIKCFHTSYRDYENYVKMGCVVYIPNSRNSRFILTGIYDKKCDIFFPKLNTLSTNPDFPVFGPLSIPLPTTLQQFKKEIENYSSYFFIDLKDEDKKKIIERILYATFVYTPTMIWKEGEVPSELSDGFHIDYDQKNIFNVFHEYLSTNEYKKSHKKKTNERIQIRNISDKEIEKSRKKYNESYPHLTRESLRDFFRFLTDIYYRQNDEKFKEEEVVGFLSILSEFIKQGQIKTKITKSGVILEYVISK